MSFQPQTRCLPQFSGAYNTLFPGGKRIYRNRNMSAISAPSGYQHGGGPSVMQGSGSLLDGPVPRHRPPYRTGHGTLTDRVRLPYLSPAPSRFSK